MALRTFPAAYKAKVAVAAIQGQKTVNEIAAEFEVHPNHVTAWNKEMLENASAAFSRKEQLGEKAFEAEGERLLRQIGQLQVELGLAAK
jgi:transposase-like protein